MSDPKIEQYQEYLANFKNSNNRGLSASAQDGEHKSIRLLKKMLLPCQWIKDQADAINEAELNLPGGGPHTLATFIMLEMLADPAFVDTLAALSDENGVKDVSTEQLLDAWLEFIKQFWAVSDAVLAAVDRVPDLKPYEGDNIAKTYKSSLFKFDDMADQVGELVGRAGGDSFEDSYLGTNKRYLEIAEKAGHPL